MPSSTSSSRPQDPPPGPWLRTWITALLLAGALLLGLEGFWRSRGHRPSIVDDQELWSYQRSRIEGATDDTVVLLGASRMQTDFSSTVFARRCPRYRLFNLAIDGHAPLAVLRDLAEDARFAGIVVCSVVAHGLRRSERAQQQPWVDAFHHSFGWSAIWNRRLRSVIQGNLVVANPRVSLLEIVHCLLDSRPLPGAQYLVTHPDRSRSADYTLTDVPRQRARRIARRRRGYEAQPTPRPGAWLEEVAEVRPWVQRIEGRGGRVVFVRFPTSGEHWALDEQNYPKQAYWDHIAAVTGATTIHFTDLPGVARLRCPDTSHLDQRDAPAFTETLLRELFERGILTPID